jgi:hypothetical protein
VVSFSEKDILGTPAGHTMTWYVHHARAHAHWSQVELLYSTSSFDDSLLSRICDYMEDGSRVLFVGQTGDISSLPRITLEHNNRARVYCFRFSEAERIIEYYAVLRGEHLALFENEPDFEEPKEERRTFWERLLDD